MSITYWVIADREVAMPIQEVLVRAASQVRAMLADGTNVNFQAALMDQRTNALSRDVVATDAWNWRPSDYLWITLPSVSGGIDVEVEHIDDRRYLFLERDMRARNAEMAKQTALLSLARDGVLYSCRASSFQSDQVYVAQLAVLSSLAEAAGGVIYTLDGVWMADLVPISGSDLRSLLSSAELRAKLGIGKAPRR